MHPITYQNFDLYIDPTPQGPCRARVTNSPRGQAEDVLAFPPDLQEVAGHLLEAGSAEARRAGADDLLAAANRLFAPLLAGAVGDLLARSLDAAAGKGLRLRLHLSPGSLAALPWELLPHPAGDRFLALDPRTPVVRYIDLPDAPRPLRDAGPGSGAAPLTVLAVLASPADLPPIDIEAEWRGLGEALAPWQAQGLVQLERLSYAGVEPLGAFLRSRPCHVLHFAGHGLLDARWSEGALAFCTAAGAAAPLTAGDLATVLGVQAEMRLLFLNACHGAAGQGAAAAGVAQRVVRAGLPAVIAMRGAVEIRAAQALAQAFYGGLAAWLPVDAALGAARLALWLRSGQTGAPAARNEWALPVLFSRADDNALAVRPIESPPVTAPPAAPPPAEPLLAPFEPPTVAIPAGPFTMGRPAGAGATPGETPAHSVTLGAYRIGCTPVSNSQFAAFVRATRQPVAPELGWQLAGFGQAPPPGCEEHPVVGVTWDEAVHYCRWLSERTGRRYRLPSEAEWERAARGADGRLYPWGDEFDAGCCNAAPAGRGHVTAVRAFSPAGDSPEGVADLAGNVWEWTSTAWGHDPNAAEYVYPYRADDGREDPAPAPGPLRELRICRGGSFGDSPDRVTGSARRRQAADSRSRRCGLRVVLEVDA